MNLLTFLVVTDTPHWMTIVNWIVGPTGVILFFLTWWRFKPKDKAEVDKTEAETTKLKADAQLVKANAEAVASDYALKIVQRLSEENDMAKKDLKEKEAILDRTQEHLNSVRKDLEKALVQVDQLQAELDRERQRNEEMAANNKAMQLKIDELTTELNKRSSK